MGKRKFWPPVSETPENIEAKIGVNDYVMDPYNPANFCENRSNGVCFPQFQLLVEIVHYKGLYLLTYLLIYNSRISFSDKRYVMMHYHLYRQHSDELLHSALETVSLCADQLLPPGVSCTNYLSVEGEVQISPSTWSLLYIADMRTTDGSSCRLWSTWHVYKIWNRHTNV